MKAFIILCLMATLNCNKPPVGIQTKITKTIQDDRSAMQKGIDDVENQIEDVIKKEVDVVAKIEHDVEVVVKNKINSVYTYVLIAILLVIVSIYLYIKKSK